MSDIFRNVTREELEKAQRWFDHLRDPERTRLTKTLDVVNTTLFNLHGDQEIGPEPVAVIIAGTSIDTKTLEGLQINGVAKIITKGPLYKKLLKAMVEQEVHHTARRIVEDVQGAQRSDAYEVQFPERVVMLKVKCKKITKIGITGNLKIERIKKEE